MQALTVIGVLIGGLVVAAILIGTGHTFLGIILGVAAIPVALVTWLTMGERF
jgi:hypothetical protein